MISDLRTIKVGDVLYEVGTTPSRIRGARARKGSWPVYVLELPTAERPNLWKVGWNSRTQIRHLPANVMRTLQRNPYRPRK